MGVRRRGKINDDSSEILRCLFVPTERFNAYYIHSFRAFPGLHRDPDRRPCFVLRELRVTTVTQPAPYGAKPVHFPFTGARFRTRTGHVRPFVRLLARSFGPRTGKRNSRETLRFFSRDKYARVVRPAIFIFVVNAYSA